MARNRTIYNVLALYASQLTGIAGAITVTGVQTGAGDILQLSRVQSFDEDFTRNFTDINQYGNLSAIDRIEVQAPDVTSSFSYYVNDGRNEKLLGFTVAASGDSQLSSCISGLLNKTTDEKNYYLLIADEGNDAAGYTNANTGVIGIGNGFITSYSVKGAVGEIPSADVQIEALNIRIYTGVDNKQANPSVNAIDGTASTAAFNLPQAKSITGIAIPTALQPGDITLKMIRGSNSNSGAFGFDDNELKIQDFTLSFDLSRTPLQKLGNRFAFSREIDFPVTASLEINANVGELKTGSLSELLCNDPNQDFQIDMKRPGCGTSKMSSLIYQFKNAKLVSQSFSSSIGDNASTNLKYEVQLGSPQQTDRGIFISGTYTNTSLSTVY
ncbi:MAG: hypothetical protein RL736_62 [Pseudomonadota bacterium]|jgi:hypothetical protein